MKRIIVLLPIAFSLVYCGSPRRTNTGGLTSESRYNSGHPGPITKSSSGNSDTISVTGSEYLPVTGRNENGVVQGLEGTWKLESMVGGKPETGDRLTLFSDGRSDASGKTFEGTSLSESMKGSKEISRDSSVVKGKDGTVYTSTTVYLINSDGSRGNKITPPQGSNYHIPERPRLQFYGSNQTFSGFTGCNKIAGRYSLDGSSKISFSDAAPSTRMVCIGDYDEQVFLQTLRRVNGYRSTGSKLELLEGSKVLLSFTRI